MSGASRSGATLTARLEDLAQLAIMLGIAGILSVAMALQFAAHEVPCPLCLLERVAMFGICLGPMLHFRHGPSARHDGFALLASVLLLVISVRQVLLDICPRVGLIGACGLHG